MTLPQGTIELLNDAVSDTTKADSSNRLSTKKYKLKPTKTKADL
jgi:hypothetical protein